MLLNDPVDGGQEFADRVEDVVSGLRALKAEAGFAETGLCALCV